MRKLHRREAMQLRRHAVTSAVAAVSAAKVTAREMTAGHVVAAASCKARSHEARAEVMAADVTADTLTEVSACDVAVSVPAVMESTTPDIAARDVNRPAPGIVPPVITGAVPIGVPPRGTVSHVPVTHPHLPPAPSNGRQHVTESEAAIRRRSVVGGSVVVRVIGNARGVKVRPMEAPRISEAERDTFAIAPPAAVEPSEVPVGPEGDLPMAEGRA